MNWIVQAYTTDTGGYFVTQRSPNDWVVLDPSATFYDGFPDENSAMAFAESIDAANQNPPISPPPTDGGGGNGGS
jgi:hypothetical protein